MIYILLRSRTSSIFTASFNPNVVLMISLINCNVKKNVLIYVTVSFFLIELPKADISTVTLSRASISRYEEKVREAALARGLFLVLNWFI